MDIARPEFKRRKRKRQIVWGAIGLVCLGAVTIGVSMALGAQQEDVLRSVLRRGAALIGMGAALGLFLAWAVTRLIQNQLWRSEERRVGKECRSRWSPYH